jgi:hypothetical protein
MNSILNETNEEKRAVERWENEGGRWLASLKAAAQDVVSLKTRSTRRTAHRN